MYHRNRDCVRAREVRARRLSANGGTCEMRPGSRGEPSRRAERRAGLVRLGR